MSQSQARIAELRTSIVNRFFDGDPSREHTDHCVKEAWDDEACRTLFQDAEFREIQRLLFGKEQVSIVNDMDVFWSGDVGICYGYDSLRFFRDENDAITFRPLDQGEDDPFVEWDERNKAEARWLAAARERLAEIERRSDQSTLPWQARASW